MTNMRMERNMQLVKYKKINDDEVKDFRWMINKKSLFKERRIL